MQLVHGVSCDIYIPSKKIAIEYDGSLWHSSELHNTSYKFNVLKSYGINLITISGDIHNKNYNTYSFNDKNLNILKFPNSLVSILSTVFKNVFNIVLDFSDYFEACKFAKARYYSDCNTSITLPDNLDFEWSPLNGYDFSYASNDNMDKLWRCFKGHTFSRRLDVINRGYVNCPYCTHRVSFNFYLLSHKEDRTIILDYNKREVEEVNDNDLIDYISQGANIRGVFYTGTLEFDFNYTSNMRPTTFRNIFDSLICEKFKCITVGSNYCIRVTEYLTRLFSSGLYLSSISNKLGKLVSSSSSN